MNPQKTFEELDTTPPPQRSAEEIRKEMEREIRTRREELVKKAAEMKEPQAHTTIKALKQLFDEAGWHSEIGSGLFFEISGEADKVASQKTDSEREKRFAKKVETHPDEPPPDLERREKRKGWAQVHEENQDRTAERWTEMQKPRQNDGEDLKLE